MKNLRYILIIFSIIPLYIIAYVGLGWFWPVMESENADRINLVLLNLSYSYVAAMIFAVIWEYIPNRNKEKKAFKISESKLITIHRKMHDLIISLMMVYDIDKNVFSLTLKDLEKCNVYSPSYSRIYYQEYKFNNTQKEIKEQGIFCFWEDLEELSNKIKGTITKINHLPTSSNLPFSILNILSKIEQDEFLSIYNAYKTYPNCFKEESPLYQFPEKFYNFIQLYKRMEKITNFKIETRKEKLSKEEINNLCKIREQIIEKLKQSKLLPPNGVIYYNRIRYKIVNGIIR